MRKYMFLGYTKQAVEYVFEVDGKEVVISSNAARYEDAITAAGLPENAELVRSFSFPIYDGRKNKDPYTFDFLTLTQGYNEKQLEEALAHNITRFLLELGSGFAYVGRQMELRMPNGQSYFPDMVFYHIKMRCYLSLKE